MGRAKVMGAGLAGSTSLGVCVNADGAGGSKKQGLSVVVGMSSTNIRYVENRTGSTAASRSMIYSMGQLSGVGRGVSAFNIPGSYTKKTGAHTVAPFPFVGWCKA